MNLDSLIGVFGSSRPAEENRELAYQLGRRLGQEGYAIITGGSTGISEAAAEGVLEQGGEVLCILPNRELASSSETITVPKGAESIYIAEGGYKTRNMVSVENCEIALFIEGGWGTLHELALALDYGQLAVIFTNSGGICETIPNLVQSTPQTAETCSVTTLEEAITILGQTI